MSNGSVNASANEYRLADYQNDKAIRAILLAARTVAIVGLSSNVLRPSNFVGFYLQRHGYRIVPVNPREQEILGETSYPSLSAIPFAVDVVDVFRAPGAVLGIAAETVQIGAKVLWLQFGVINFQAAAKAQAQGVQVVMDRCMKVEHARHMGRMHWLGFNTGVVTARRLRIE